jgi:apolipoprotein D and lipocalin family protein
MKNSMSPTPHTDSSRSTPASGLPHGMDALAYEIARVERRLIARELGIQSRVQELRRGASSALRPRRSMVPWAGVLLMLWPLLPRFLRPRLSPASTVTLFGIAAPTMKRLLTNHPAGPATVPQLDLSRYMGQWHEVVCVTHAGASAAAPQTTLHFALEPQPDGTPWVSVLRHSPTPAGRVRASRGAMRPVPGSGGARMKQSFQSSYLRWWPGAWDDHWVLHVNSNYTEALVGDAGRRELRVLSREPDIEPARLQALLDIARTQGYRLR